MIYYSGIGSRRASASTLALTREIGAKLAKQNYVCRTGGASGCDEHYFGGAYREKGAIELFLPWKRFNGMVGPFTENVKVFEKPEPETEVLAERFHPNWARLKWSVRPLMMRNVHQVMGPSIVAANAAIASGVDGVLSSFVVCWTPDAADGKKILTTEDTGGTGHAIRTASAHNIPVYNLANTAVCKRWEEWIKAEADIKPPV